MGHPVSIVDVVETFGSMLIPKTAFCAINYLQQCIKGRNPSHVISASEPHSLKRDVLKRVTILNDDSIVLKTNFTRNRIVGSGSEELFLRKKCGLNEQIM